MRDDARTPAGDHSKGNGFGMDAQPVNGVSGAISFVTVAFCDELRHNLLASPCVRDSRNELVVVDNAANLHFDTLSAAWQCGIDRARHDLVALVHEDVLLLPEWQASLEACLDALEAEDSHWGLESARGAGLRLVAVTSSYPAEELAGAELVVNGLAALTLPALDRLCES